VTIRLGANLTSAGNVPEGFTVADDEAVLRIGGAAVFRLSGGREIFIQPELGVGGASVRLFLLGIAFAALFHQRGQIPFHSTAVQSGDRGILLAGPSGIGKTSLGAALLRLGGTLVSDDLSVVGVRNGESIVWPGIRSLFLWKHTLNEMGIDSRALIPLRSGLDKFSLPVENVASGPARIEAVYLLEKAYRPGLRLVSLAGLEKIRALARHVYRPQFVTAMKRSHEHLARLVSMARGVRLVVVQRGPDVSSDAVADAIREDSDFRSVPETR
jgi:hypothetical protein